MSVWRCEAIRRWPAPRAAKRRELREVACAEFDQVRQMVANGRLKDCDTIGMSVGRVIEKSFTTRGRVV